MEPRAEGGPPDLTIRRGGRGVLVVEAKFKKKVGRVERDIEPRDPEVVEQAIRYAVRDGFPFYATCNVRRLILFQLRPGIKAYESELLSADYSLDKTWAKEVLLLVLGRKAASLKPADAALVDTFHEAFADLAPELFLSLRVRLREPKFSDRMNVWLASQGLDTSEDTYRRIAEQTTYLQMNKILFYKVLRVIYPDRLGVLEIREDEDVSEKLTSFYSAVKGIDYDPIYQEDILAEVPLTAKAEIRIRTLIDTLKEFDFASVESDFIGRLYENLIDPKERKRLGQFYTPPAVAELITTLTVQKASAIVMDPPCGSGGFLVKAYIRLRELKGRTRNDSDLHRQLLTQIFGIDINQFPAHLSVVNLAIQMPKAHIEQVQVVVKDFFDTRPGVATLAGFDSVSTDGKSAVVRLPPRVDAIIGNPPYIRQEFLGESEKEKVSRCITADFGGRIAIGSNSSPLVELAFNKQSDVFVYFFLHAFAYLKSGGRLGFITSNKWLEVGYGEELQAFLLGSAKIVCVMEFDRAVFPDLEVDTSITVVEKETDDSLRARNPVRFLRVKEAIPATEILALIQTGFEDVDSERLHFQTVTQASLKVGKWNAYLSAPPIFWTIKKKSRTRPLSEVVDEVRYGLKTGCDPYFILSKERAKELGIEKRFLSPCVPAAETLAGLTVRPGHVTDCFFIVREPIEDLAGTEAERYIRYGERLVVEPAKRRKIRMKLTEIPTV
ncbi:MAG: N-6 DNA methylase, partial [Thermoplasmata archaeon]|nr:N-6 DNA methylase [Thermoplasmata archaeon]